MGGIAVIGWGSLIWDLDGLAPMVEGGWRLGQGPVLALEFSRVSPKRRGALAVVIDPDQGAPCRTAWIASRRRIVGHAVADLAARERCPEAAIGRVSVADGIASGRATDTVAAWCVDEGLAGAVWTDLAPNFATATGRPFSLAAALAYLAGLSGPARAEAERYIAHAPAETATPLRRALAAEPWWGGAGALA